MFIVCMSSSNFRINIVKFNLLFDNNMVDRRPKRIPGTKLKLLWSTQW